MGLKLTRGSKTHLLLCLRTPHTSLLLQTLHPTDSRALENREKQSKRGCFALPYLQNCSSWAWREMRCRCGSWRVAARWVAAQGRAAARQGQVTAGGGWSAAPAPSAGSAFLWAQRHRVQAAWAADPTVSYEQPPALHFSAQKQWDFFWFSAKIPLPKYMWIVLCPYICVWHWECCYRATHP